MIIMQVSHAIHNYGTGEHIKHSVQYQTIKVSPLWKEIQTFWLKIMFYGFLWDFWMQVTRRFQVQIR